VDGASQCVITRVNKGWGLVFGKLRLCKSALSALRQVGAWWRLASVVPVLSHCGLRLQRASATAAPVTPSAGRSRPSPPLSAPLSLPRPSTPISRRSPSSPTVSPNRYAELAESSSHDVLQATQPLSITDAATASTSSAAIVEPPAADTSNVSDSATTTSTQPILDAAHVSTRSAAAGPEVNHNHDDAVSVTAAAPTHDSPTPVHDDGTR
jgi:hypothetical protein